MKLQIFHYFLVSFRYYLFMDFAPRLLLSFRLSREEDSFNLHILTTCSQTSIFFIVAIVFRGKVTSAITKHGEIHANILFMKEVFVLRTITRKLLQAYPERLNLH